MFIGNPKDKGLDISYDRACMFIALDHLFPQGYEGREFLADIYSTDWKGEGFPSQYLPLLEELSPCIKLVKGDRSWHGYKQGDRFWKLTDFRERKRYKINISDKLIVCYRYKDSVYSKGRESEVVYNGHAECMSPSTWECLYNVGYGSIDPICFVLRKPFIMETY